MFIVSTCPSHGWHACSWQNFYEYKSLRRFTLNAANHLKVMWPLIKHGSQSRSLAYLCRIIRKHLKRMRRRGRGGRKKEGGGSSGSTVWGIHYFWTQRPNLIHPDACALCAHYIRCFSFAKSKPDQMRPTPSIAWRTLDYVIWAVLCWRNTINSAFSVRGQIPFVPYVCLTYSEATGPRYQGHREKSA